MTNEEIFERLSISIVKADNEMARGAAEKVRFAASGTEATMCAIKLANAYTGRNKTLKFEGSYHGAHDYGVMKLFPQSRADFPLAQPTSAGTSQALSQEVLIVPFNDLKTATQIIDWKSMRGISIKAQRVKGIRNASI